MILLLLAASAFGTSQEELDRQERTLDYGLWNNRISAVYALGEYGRDGLPYLVHASDDADWQVRLTVVHFMGKLGPVAAPALADIARVEPCPSVRISALRWLAGMGEPARANFESVITPEDQREMDRDPDRYGTERMGKPLVIDAPDGMTKDFFDGGLDLRVCASSEHSGRRHGGPHRSRRDDPYPRGSDDPAVVTAPVPVKTAAAPAAVSPKSPPGVPESLPGGPASPEVPVAASGVAEFASVDARRGTRSSVRPTEERTPESLPPGPPVPPHPETVVGTAEIEPDAGTGKPEDDPVPRLIESLSSKDARRRARAADELGKRGDAARPAVPALRRALKDDDRRVRASAALALGSVGGSSTDVVADVRRALRDKDEDVRFSAAMALERMRASR
jgi:hypothetical protein